MTGRILTTSSLTTTDSNIWGGASGHTYNFTRNPDGTTDIDVIVVREAGTSGARGGPSASTVRAMSCIPLTLRDT